MAYNPNVPSPFDRIVVSQGDILANYQSISDATTVNHSVLNSADQGKHKFVQLPEIADIPFDLNKPVITNSTITKSIVIGILEKGFASRPFEFEIKYRQIILPVNFYMSYSGYELPSGLKIKNFFVSNAVSSTGTITIDLGGTFPVFTGTPFFHLVTMSGSVLDGNDFVYLQSIVNNKATFLIRKRTTNAPDLGFVSFFYVTFFGA